MGEVLMHPIDGAGSDAATVNGHTVESNVPADAKFTDTTYPVFAGATASENGTTGLVPEPTIEDTDKYLCGDGTWKTVSGGTETSDSPVEIPIEKSTSVTHGTITVYRIGHLLHVDAVDLTVDFSRTSRPGYIDVCSIPYIADEFMFTPSSTTWVSFSMVEPLRDHGVAVATVDDEQIPTVVLLGSPGIHEGIYFLMTVPLLDKKEE